MRIKELEEKSGIPRTTIHFYLRQGLLHPPRKTSQTMADYDNSHLLQLKRIQKIKKGKRVPVTFLKEQMGVIQGPAHGDPGQDTEALFGKPSPTTREKKQKYRLIISKAIEIFSKNGYHNTRISDITGGLDISTGTFYLYFRNKRELFVEVIDDIFRTIVGDASTALKDENDFIERMKIRGRVFYDNYTKYSELLNQLRAEMTRESVWPAEKIKHIYHGLTLPVIRDIQAAMDEGVVRKMDPDLIAYALTGLIEIMSLRLSLDDKYTIDDIIDFLVETSKKWLMKSPEDPRA